MRILGVDPGSRLVGYGCVEYSPRGIRHLGHGTLRISKKIDRSIASFEERLLLLHELLSQVIHQLQPEVMVLEKVFFAKNALSALKLGQARGAILLTGKLHALEIAEYSATQVKQAVVGYGRAEKEQVARMVQLLVGPQEFETFDSSDGLALAICHAHAAKAVKLSPSLQLWKRGRTKKKMTLAQAVGHIDVKKLGKY